MVWMVRDVPWKEPDWKINDKEIWGRGMWTDLSEWAKHMKIFITYVTVHQRVTLGEEDFKNQMTGRSYL